MKATAIEKIERHAKKIASGKHKTVRPGLPFRFSEACTIHDCCWQGDLGIEIAADLIPPGFSFVEKPTARDMQLVPGNTHGAKHCLDSLDGVEIYRPQNWSEASLVGPFLRLSKERTITHPTHGAVTIPAGFAVQCRYQQNYDEQLRQSRRAAD